MPEVPHRVCFAMRGPRTIVTGRLHNYVSPRIPPESVEEDDLQFMLENEDVFKKEADNLLEWIDSGCNCTMSCRSLFAEERIISSGDFLYFEPRSSCFIITLNYNTPLNRVFLRVTLKDKKTFVEQKINCR